MSRQNQVGGLRKGTWIPLHRSLLLIFSKKQLFGWSALLILLTVAITWGGYSFATDLLDQLTGDFLHAAPATDSIWGWIKYISWLAGSWLYSFVSRVVSFYLAFLLAYTLTTPGYGFLSTSAEKLFAADDFEPDLAMNLPGIAKDLWEGLKIALFGILVTVAAIFLNLIPGIGQVMVIALYTYYSALMFIDYPASRRRWSLGRKIHWLTSNSSTSLRLGILPALLSMIPIVNIFFIALLFPVLTIHSTLNFTAREIHRRRNGYGN